MKNKSALSFLMQNDTFNANQPAPTQSAGTFDMAAEAAGLSEDQQKVRAVRKEAGVSYITLNSGRRIRFASVYITADSLSIDTCVHPYNLRTQEAVTEEMCEDIIPSVAKAGVKMPALATRDQSTGIIMIFDGSRRRFAALFCGCGLHIDVTDEDLNDDEITELSHITNLTKISSLYDRGRYYQMQKEKFPEMSQNELAAELGVPSSTIGYALQAYEVPLPLYQVFSKKTELGRTQTQALHKLVKSLGDSELDALVEQCKRAKPQANDKDAFELIKKLAGIETSKKSEQGEQIGKIRIQTKGTKLSIDTPDEATLEEIYQLLQDKYL